MGVLLSLCNVSLLGVGFSSWVASVIVLPEPVDIEASVGEVIKTNYFSNLVCTPFTLGPNGLENDETIVSSAKMTLTFDVDNSSAYSTRNSNGDILFSITMSCSNLDFLKNCIGTSNSPNRYRKLSTEQDFS